MSYEWLRRKLEVQKLIQALKDHDQIELLANNYYYLKVKFTATNLTEYWAINDDGMKRRRRDRFKLPKGPFFTEDLELKSQFETNPLYPDQLTILKPHFIIERKMLNEAGWCTLRLKVHEIAAILAEEGLTPLQYTKPILGSDLDKVLSDNLDRYQLSPIRFGVRTNQKIYGRRIINHFEPLNEVAIKTWANTAALVRAITHIVQSKKPLTMEGIVRRASGGGFVNPNFYRSWFRGRLSLAGSRVLDLNPNGSRALAVMLEGGSYDAMDYSKLSDFLLITDINKDKYDIAFLNGVSPVSDIHQIISAYRDVAKTLVVCTKKELMSDMISLYSPKYTLRISIRTPYSAAVDDYIFIIDQT